MPQDSILQSFFIIHLKAEKILDLLKAQRIKGKVTSIG